MPSDAAALWRSIAAVPLLKRAVLSPCGAIATLQTETADVDNATRPLLTQVVDCPAARTLPVPPIPASPADPPIHAPCGRRAVRFAAHTDAKGEGRVEHWVDGAVVAQVPWADIHGPPLRDTVFQHVCWAVDGSVVYVAERAPPKKAHPWSPKATEGAAPHYEARDDWGEAYTEYASLSLFCCDFADGAITELLPAEFTAEYSATMPELVDGLLVFAAYENAPRRLGIAHCSSRRNRLFTLSLAVAPAAPRDVTFARSVKTIVRRPGTTDVALFAAPPDSDAHLTASELVLWNTADPDARPRSLVPIIDTPPTADAFPGLYVAGGYADLTWTSQGALLVNSIRRSAAVLYHIDVASGRVTALHDAVPECGTWKVLDARGPAVLAAFQSPAAPPQVWWCPDATAPTARFTVVWDGSAAALRRCVPTAGAVFDGAAVRRLRPPGALHSSEVVATKVAAAAATVVLVHGGPHATDTGLFTRLGALLLLSGLSLFSVNYGGSLGFGQRCVDELPGNAGTHDVQDVVGCVEWAAEHDELDKARLFVLGGSHGGFLSCHLTAQYPGLFRATSMRNPVTCLSSMLFETDIPDWCVCEGGSADPRILFDASPMAHVAAVMTPTLVALGLNDRRVPPPQGRAWCHAVRSNTHRPAVRLLEYPGTGHALDSVHGEADYAIQTLLFFQQYLS